MTSMFLLPVSIMGAVSFVIMRQKRFVLFFGWLLTAILALALVFWLALQIPPTSEGPMLVFIAFALFQSGCAMLGFFWGRLRDRQAQL